MNPEEIKKSIVECLRRKFPQTSFYKDGEIKKYPNFYIRFLDVILKPLTLLKTEIYRAEYYVRIEYRENEQTSLITNLNTKLDDVGFKMLECLRTVTIDGERINTDITKNENIDNIRIFEFNFFNDVYFDIETFTKMQNLQLKMEGSGEN